MRLIGASLTLTLALSTFACGGSSQRHSDADDAGSGGTGASGGTGGRLSPPAAVGLSLTLSMPLATEVQNIGSRSCTAGGSGAFTYTIGQPAPTKTISDGTDGLSVVCTIKRVDDGYSINALVKGSDNNTKVPVSFAIVGSVPNDPALPTDADVTFYTPATVAIQSHSAFPPCALDNITTLKPGAMLADIECPMLVALDDSRSGCRAQGTIAIEYCATE